MISWRALIFLGLIVSGILVSCLAQKVAAVKASMLEGMLVFEDQTSHKAGQKTPRIMISRADGTGRHLLVDYGAEPIWFPSGDRVIVFVPHRPLYFADSRQSGKSKIVDLDGRTEREIPYHVTDVSPDGTHLLVQYGTNLRDVGPSKTGYEIFIYDLRTDKLRKLIGLNDLPKELRVLSLIGAKWFPDGEHILFQLRGPDEYGLPTLSTLTIVRSDGTGFRLLTKMPEIKGPTYLTGPIQFDISPNGEKIVYVQELFNAKGAKTFYHSSQLYIMDADGTKSRQLTKSGTWKSNPVWSPDGTKILYTDDRSAPDVNSEQALFVMNADGSNSRRIFPRSWRHFIKFFVLHEADDYADWWAPSSAELVGLKRKAAGQKLLK